MCGIFGIVFKDFREDLGKILLQAGRKLTYRGYDSVGMAAFSRDSIELKKDIGEFLWLLKIGPLSVGPDLFLLRL